ncbi:hypothetical protein LRB11_03740 [Ectothiorhodospira haloalkaliphila]|uniref:NERD domain-containing protein n=1 Tax=Ectothiorhodospira haloalkaliphila TaxID=421628 RepID=UPI001EE8448A|nr:nuclease-related domain-containing protein [Ectothiorhodospira haloalkaliphila]MCG5524043.1 hypothetical protein [Ectothiorhodospira haloalkaliphila]
MLIKPVDDLAPHIEELNRLLERASEEQARQIRARILALEGRLAAAAELDQQLADSDQAVVIHDLHLEVRGTSVHFDHVVFNRRMEAFVLDSRFFNTGVRVEAEERFFHVDEEVDGNPLEVIDPLNDLAEQVRALGNAVLFMSWPHRLGVRLIPQVHGRIVVGPDAHVHLAGEHNPGGQVTWLEDVLEQGLRGKPGQGGNYLAMLRALASTVSIQALQGCAEALVGRHVARAPDYEAAFGISDQAASPGVAPEQAARPEDADTAPAAPAAPREDDAKPRTQRGRAGARGARKSSKSATQEGAAPKGKAKPAARGKTGEAAKETAGQRRSKAKSAGEKAQKSSTAASDAPSPPASHRDEGQASEKKLPSSRIASALGMKTGPFLDLLAEQGLLEQKEGAWQLTEKGTERGGEQRGSGNRISFAWPESVKEEARAARDGG